MSDTENDSARQGGGTTRGEPMPVPEDFEPADSYNGYHAFLFGAGRKIHVVDPRTFDNSHTVVNADGSRYEGYSANVGDAHSHCGRDLSGRMRPLETDAQVLQTNICKTCLNALKMERKQDE